MHWGLQFSKSQEKINYLMFMDDIKLFAKKKKNEKDLETDTNNKNIRAGYRHEIWHRKMCSAHKEEWKKTNNGRSRTAKSRKSQNTSRKGKSQVPENIGSVDEKINE